MLKSPLHPASPHKAASRSQSMVGGFLLESPPFGGLFGGGEGGEAGGRKGGEEAVVWFCGCVVGGARRRGGPTQAWLSGWCVAFGVGGFGWVVGACASTPGRALHCQPALHAHHAARQRGGALPLRWPAHGCPPPPPEGGDSPCRTSSKPVDVSKRAKSRTARPHRPSPASLARSASLQRRSVGPDSRDLPAPGARPRPSIRAVARRDVVRGGALRRPEAISATLVALAVVLLGCVQSLPGPEAAQQTRLGV
jgi:hypothetical protein